MTSSDDRFATFVDLLAEALADPEAEAAPAAERMHLSRFHFDRLIASVAGESPARLRRRILLERAAFRLLSGSAHVLDVALEAGYGSHSGFTRAFSRAYGTSPSQWRAAPGQIKLAAPSSVHFHPPAGIRMPARQEVTAMELLSRIVRHHVWLVGEIVHRLERLGDAELDTLVRVSCDNEDGQMTLRSITSRLIGQMDMWNCAIGDRAYDFAQERDEPVASMRARLAAVGPAFVAQVDDVVAEGRLDDTFVDALCDPPEVFTYGGMIAHVLTFAAYNRTLVVQQLAELGVGDLGFGDPMLWVADTR